MKSTLKDFLIYGLRKLDEPAYADGCENNRYIVVDGYDFAGTYFLTKQEAKEMFNDKKNEENR